MALLHPHDKNCTVPTLRKTPTAVLRKKKRHAPAGGTHKIEKSPVLHLNEATTTKMYMERKRDKGGGRKPFLIKVQNRQREERKKKSVQKVSSRWRPIGPASRFADGARIDPGVGSRVLRSEASFSCGNAGIAVGSDGCHTRWGEGPGRTPPRAR